MDKKAISSETLEQVSGGRMVGTTSYGYPVDDKGNVTFTDKVGEKVVLTKDQWKALEANYLHTKGNPEAYLSTVTIKEMRQAGLIPSNPLGV